MEVNQEIFQWFATLGVGGVLAAFMFYFYRKDMKENADRIKELIDSYKAEQTGWKEIVINNTKAMAECTKMTEQVFRYLIDTHQFLRNGDQPDKVTLK